MTEPERVAITIAVSNLDATIGGVRGKMWGELFAAVDRIADERVLAFARGALLAGKDADRPGHVPWLVTEHIRNTVAQIEALEKAAADL